MVSLTMYALIFSFLRTSCHSFLNIKQEWYEENDNNCDRIILRPFFKNQFVLGIKWRVYYIWNTLPENNCKEMSFRKVNPLLVKHVRTAMSPYLREQPRWSDSSLFLTMSRSRHVLLIQDEAGTPGGFIQIPNFIQSQYGRLPDMTPIPLFRMVIKVIFDGRYLLMADCSDGVIYLLGHTTDKPLWAEIRAIAQNYDYGPGLPACTM